MRRNWVVIIIVLLLVVWGIFDYTKTRSAQSEIIRRQQATAEASVGIEKGNKAFDFELLTISGDPIKLSDLTGKKVILNFWATWCPPCRAEMPHMERFYKDYKEEVVILAVNLTNTEAKESDIKDFVDDFGLTFPIVMDTEGEIADIYKIFAYPTSYMIDTHGIIQEIYQGPINYDIMKKAISKLY